MSLARILLTLLLVAGPVCIAHAGEYDEDNRGEGEMLREQQKEYNRNEFDGYGDRNERQQDREDRLEERQDELKDERENGSGGIKEFFDN